MASMAMPHRDILEFCRLCGSTRIEATKWYPVNYPDRETSSDEPPTDRIYCPRCDREVFTEVIYRTLAIPGGGWSVDPAAGSGSWIYKTALGAVKDLIDGLA